MQTLTTSDVEQYIRLTLKQYGLTDITVSFNRKLGTKGKAWGIYRWYESGIGEKKILLSPKILYSFALFRHVFLHELAHALDHKERGTLFVNQRMNAHGANFNKWCKNLGIKKGRFIPRELMP